MEPADRKMPARVLSSRITLALIIALALALFGEMHTYLVAASVYGQKHVFI